MPQLARQSGLLDADSSRMMIDSPGLMTWEGKKLESVPGRASSVSAHW